MKPSNEAGIRSASAAGLFMSQNKGRGRAPLREMLGSAPSGHHTGNRRRKSAPAPREISWQRRQKQNCGSRVMQKVKKKKKGKTCLDHLLRAEPTHSAGFFTSE